MMEKKNPSEQLLSLAEKVERLALDIEAYSALIEKYNQKLRRSLKTERERNAPSI